MGATKETGIQSAGTIGATGIKEPKYKPARRRPGTEGKPEVCFLDGIGKFVV